MAVLMRMAGGAAVAEVVEMVAAAVAQMAALTPASMPMAVPARISAASQCKLALMTTATAVETVAEKVEKVQTTYQNKDDLGRNAQQQALA